MKQIFLLNQDHIHYHQLRYVFPKIEELGIYMFLQVQVTYPLLADVTNIIFFYLWLHQEQEKKGESYREKLLIHTKRAAVNSLHRNLTMKAR